MNRKKNHSIRSLILRLVITAASVSLLVTSLFAVISMLKIKKESENALMEQAKTNLSEVMDKKIAVADLKFRDYKKTVNSLMLYIDNIYKNYSSFDPLDVGFADPKNGGKLVMQPVLASDSVKWEDVKEEAGVLANASE